jgi:transglutaminase-like putative cysteine protease
MTKKIMSGDPHINTRAAWRPLLKPIGRLVVAAQLALALQPLAVLAQDKGQVPYNPIAQAQMRRLAQLDQSIQRANAARDRSAADASSEQLREAQELVGQLKAAGTPGKADKHRRLRELVDASQAGVPDVRAEFAATRAMLRGKGTSAEMLARHDAAVARFEQRAGQFARIAAVADDAERVRQLDAFFAQDPAKRRMTPLDPKKLPWSTPKPNTRAPAETKTAWFQNLYADQKVRLAQEGGSNIGPLQFNIAPDPGQAPTAADLAETDEVPITPAIRAKALELGNNPVNIFNWVRNNIEWVPTAGAIQSAQDTLDKLRGNATDTASLLIALLRAANVPARYQWGTIDVPAAQAQNWVGGATRPEAVLQILNQGGIAARGVSAAGRLGAIRMEHVWVDAYVNWSPGRGSRNATANQHPNPNAQMNAWVPLDPSYKQYGYAPAMNLQQNVPFDANALLSAAQQGATVNAAEGWVQNFNQAAIQNQLTDYQNRLQAYIASTPTGANSTVADVIGKKIIPQQLQPLLAGTLSNSVVLQGSQAAAMPSALQHKFVYKIYASPTDQADDSPLLAYTEKTSKLVGKRLTLTYVPASQADADVIASYLPKPHADGSPIQPSELPASLPAYLIQLKPQITLDGQVVAQSATSVQMGTDLYSTGGFTQLYDATQWDLTSEESNVAGNATAIGISAGGISVAQLSALKARLAAAASLVQSGSNEGLSGEAVSGDMLSAIIWTWFADGEFHSRLTQNQAGIIESPGLSYGVLHSLVNPTSSWGVIRKVTFPGVNIDIGHLRSLTWAKDSDPAKWVAYNRLRGQEMSAMEASVPERFFNDPHKCNLQGASATDPSLPACPEGVSAMKAISIAAQAGQKVFTITRQVYADNPGIVSGRLSAHSETTRDRVQQALDAGYEVTIHEAPVASNGWSGAGFTMIDPSTGAGGYLIEGNSNGGWFAALSIFFWLLSLVLVGTQLGLWVILLGFGAGLLSTIYNCSNVSGLNLGLLIANQTVFTLVGLMSALLLATIFTGGALIVALLISSVIMRLYNTLVMQYLRNAAGCS